MLDLIIIGGSAAGTAASVYASRRKLNFKVVAKDLGGEVATAGEVENYPGTKSITGVELSKKFQEQLEFNKVDIENNVDVISVEKKDGGDDKSGFVVKGKRGEEEVVFESKAVIVATGAKPRHLEVPGEKEMYHKGVTYCTVCDGPLFKGKITATIGSGNSALESAIMMSEISSKVYVLSKYPDFKGDQILIDKLKSHPNVEILYEAMTQSIEGEGMVSGLNYKDKEGVEHKLEVQGVMVHIGLLPNSKFIECAEKTEKGNILVDRMCKTNCPGIFAAGDVTDFPYFQIGIATGMGISAALSAISYLNTLE